MDEDNKELREKLGKNERNFIIKSGKVGAPPLKEKLDVLDTMQKISKLNISDYEKDLLLIVTQLATFLKSTISDEEKIKRYIKLLQGIYEDEKIVLAGRRFEAEWLNEKLEKVNAQKELITKAAQHLIELFENDGMVI